MKKLHLSAAIAVTAIAVTAAAASDPVLMTINKVPVHLSEFEYLYNKNNSQQLQPQTLDEYVDMFVNYKLKVAAAVAAGMDTTASFRNEFDGYATELAQSRMVDSTVYDSLLHEAYDHVRELRYVSHIMLPPADGETSGEVAMARADSVRNAILSGATTFEDAAAASIDRASATRGGRMGWVLPGRYPWPFEKASYDTPLGGISPVINSGFGLHIIRVDEIKPNPGEVEAEHILKLTHGKTPEEAAHARVAIDSLYNVVTQSGVDFEDVARRESEDPGSAKQGGKLGWYSSGMMVAPFDSASFAMQVGEISRPVTTAYGYHIIHKTGARPVASFEDMRQSLEQQINGDERGQLPAQRRLDALVKQYKGQVLDNGMAKVRRLIEDCGGYDSTAIATLKASTIPVYTVSGKKYAVASVMTNMPVTASGDVDNAMKMLQNAAIRSMRDKVAETYRKDLVNIDPDYRNIYNEYRDGILLYNISNQEVWERAAKDTTGLEKYFAEHRADYTWKAPKFKGYVIFSTNDSVQTEVKAFTDSLDNAGSDFTREELVKMIDKRFGRDAKVERVLAAKGDNAITDYLAFDGPKPENQKMRWQSYYAYRGRVIDQPEDAFDVRGQVTTDYQAVLEKEWVKKLHERFPVKINRKVLAKAK